MKDKNEQIDLLLERNTTEQLETVDSFFPTSPPTLEDAKTLLIVQLSEIVPFV